MKCFVGLTKKPLKLTLALFVLALLFVGIHGEFPINDDWIFFRQLEGFRELGHFTINAVIDPAFITQGLLGHLWARIFGLSFENLRLLTILITLGLIFAVNKMLQHLEVNDGVRLAVLLLTVFNPIIFTSTFSFMTENFYLFFYISSLYFFLKHFEKEKTVSLVLALILAGAAMLLRQLGIVLFIAYLMTAVMYKKISIKNFVLFFVIGTFFFYTYSTWPRYLDGGVSTSLAGLISNMFHSSDVWERILSMIWALPYFAFFLLPLAFYNKDAEFKKHNFVVRVAALVGFYFLTTWLYEMDIFPVGSVLYVEGLHVKSDFRSHFGLFNNVVFKSLLATLIGLACVRIVLFYNKLKKLDFTSMFLLLTSMGSFAILFFGNDFYERYTMPAIFSFIFLFVYYFKKYVDFGTKFQWSVMGLFIVFSVLLQFDYISHTRLRWKQAYALQADTGYVNSIYVDGTYAKHFAAIVNEDYKGFDSAPPPGDKRCYVQRYYNEEDTSYSKFWDRIDEFTKKKIGNPEIHDAKRNDSLPNIKKHLDELSYNEEYFSPIYNLVGKKAYVGSWCETKN